MESFIKKFKIEEGKDFSLKKLDPSYTGEYRKDGSKELLASYKEQLSSLQDKFYAEHSHSLLVLFQALDAAGKDSAIKHVMSGVNPQGCQVFSFKQPSSEDLEHDFLRRHYKALPEKGRIGIHNRSHYENVLVCKVHPELVLKENLPGHTSLNKINKSFWDSRYKSINHFEKHLNDNGTVVLKFFLHLSKEKQKERFLKRIDDKKKNWKFSAGDIAERAYWNDYMNAYEDAILNTSTENAPWFVIPADNKWFTRLAVISIITETLDSLSPQYPVLPDSASSHLQEYKSLLNAER